VKKLPILLAAIAACASNDPVPDGMDPLVPINAALASVARNELTAVVASQDVVAVTAETDGHIKLAVHVGDRVRAGALLAELDDSELRAGLASARGDEIAAQGDVLAASGELSMQQRRLAMDQKLAVHGYVASHTVRIENDECTVRRGRAQSAAGRYYGAKARRVEIERLLAATQIIAPRDGVIASIDVKPGDFVHKGSHVVQIADPDHLALQFAAPPDLAVRIGARVEAAFGRAHPVRATVRKLSEAANHLVVVVAEPDVPSSVELGSSGKVWLVDGR
jgi:multidrug efflux pump subunit AcrA (membrane-fusion protein)